MLRTVHKGELYSRHIFYLLHHTLTALMSLVFAHCRIYVPNFIRQIILLNLLLISTSCT